MKRTGVNFQNKMAQRVVDNLQNDYLICSICLGRYTDPRLLPCGHTFCRQCLSDHIQQTVLSANANQFKCPNDRGDVRKPGPNTPVREWANAFPVDTFISSLLQAVQSHEHGGNAPQEPEPASSSVGTSARRGQALTRPRPLRPQRQSRRQQQSTGPPPPPPQHESNELTCLEHPRRPLEYFCLGCNILICSHCAVQNHRSPRCECVANEEALGRLSSKIDRLKTRFENQMTYIQDLNRNGMPFDNELENSKSQAFSYLSEVENNVSEFTQQCLQEVENLKRTVRETGQDIPRENQNMSSLLGRLQDSRQGYETIFNAPSGPSFLTNLSRYEKQADEYESEIERAVSGNAIPKIEFITNTGFQNFLRNPPPVACMEVKESSSRARRAPVQIRREGTFNVRNNRGSRTSR